MVTTETEPDPAEALPILKAPQSGCAPETSSSWGAKLVLASTSASHPAKNKGSEAVSNPSWNIVSLYK